MDNEHIYVQDHDADCGCGHDHKGHHRDHECHCQTYDVDESFIGVEEHEGAMVASYRFSLAGSFDDAKENVPQRVAAFAQAMREQGGFVGHIKLLVKFGEQMLKISCTETEPLMEYFPADAKVDSVAAYDRVRVEGVAIVFGIDEDQLGTAIREMLVQGKPTTSIR